MGLPIVLSCSGLRSEAGGLRTGQRERPQAPFLALTSGATPNPEGSAEVRPGCGADLLRSRGFALQG